MDITTLRVAATLLCFVTFLGILYWTFKGKNRERFEQDARIPFEQD